MATGAGVVVVQAGDGVEPEQTPDVREARVWRPPQPRFQRRFDPAAETELLQPPAELRVDRVAATKQRLRRN